MQVMGTVARERGVDGPFLAALCNPDVGIWYGAAQLTRLLRRYEGCIEGAIDACNAGNYQKKSTPGSTGISTMWIGCWR